MYRHVVFLLLITLLCGFSLEASHLVGGSLSYTYKGYNSSTNRHSYEIQIKIYRDCFNTGPGQPFPTPFDSVIAVGIYFNNFNKSLYQSLNINLDKETDVDPPSGGSDCSFKPNVCLKEGIYTTTISVPPSNVGYHITHVRCCRNNQENLVDFMGQTYYGFIPPTSTTNSSPYFDGVPAPYICIGDTVSILYSAKDDDGDSLVYSFKRPFQGGDQFIPAPQPGSFLSLPIAEVDYGFGYSVTNPFGNGGLASIDSQTGLVQIKSPRQGFFALAVQVEEYRDGNLISSISQDVSIIVIQCPSNPTPRLVSTGNNQRKTTFNVTAGQKLTFPIEYSDDDSLTFVRFGDMFDDPNWSGTRPTLSDTSGGTTISSTFSWDTDCEQWSPRPYIFTVIVQDKGCPPKSRTNTFKINVKPYRGTIDLTGPDTVCLGSSHKFTAVKTNEGNPVTWIYSMDSLTETIADKQVEAHFNDTGLFRILAIEKSNEGCIGDTFFKYIRVFDYPEADPGTDKTMCSEDTINLGPAKWPDRRVKIRWLHTGAVIDTGVSPTFTFNSGLQNPINVQVPCEYDLFGCKTLDSIKVRINPKPAPQTISGNDFPCFRTNENYSAQLFGGSKYDWSVTGGKFVAVGQGPSVIINWNDTINNEIQVIETNTFGCSGDTAKLPVKINLIRIDSIIGSSPVCPNASRVRYSVKPTVGSFYTWNLEGGQFATSNGLSFIRVNWGDSGTGKIQVFETNKEGCVSDTISRDILKAYELKTPPIIGPVSVCEFTENVKYEVFNTNGSSYNWSVNGGLLVSGQDNAEIRVNWLEEGLAQLSTTQYAFDSVNNKACFGDTQTLNVNLRPNPESDTIIGDSVFCMGERIEFSTNGFPNSTYYWSINNTTRDTFGPGNNTFSRIADSIGSFSVGVKEITEYGCEGDVLRKGYSVHPVPQTQGIFGQDTACLSGFSQLEYSVIGNEDSEYEWLIEGGSIIGDDSLQNVIIDWQTYPAGTIKAVERSLFGCGGDTLEKRVIIDATELSMNYVSTQFENEETVEIDWDVVNPAYLKNQLLLYRRLSGEDPNNLIESIEPNIARYEDLKLKTSELSYAYLVTTEDLCGNPIQSDIHESILLKGSKNDEYSISLNWNSYDGWQNGVESYEILRKRNDQPNYENFMVTEETAVNIDVGLDGYDQCYRIKALEEGGNNQSYSNSVCFSFRGIIYIPNAFSPNGDGINDFFKVVGSNFKSFKMQIFSRWGELLFESTDINEAWDGTYKGSKVSVDTYLLMITYDDTKRINSYRGTVNVID